MTLKIESDRRVSGSYFYLDSLKDIPVSGQVAPDRTIILRELGQPGRATGMFHGQFLEMDAQGRKIGFEQIAGFWSKLDGTGSRLFRLVQGGGRLRRRGENRYAVAGLPNDPAVERFAQGFRSAVLAGDRQKVAAVIHLPIVVRIGGWPTKVRSREILLARYEAIFGPPFRQALEGAVPHNMFARRQGVMLGEHGEVWIGDREGDLKVVAINN
jgi:hypothetical protein